MVRQRRAEQRLDRRIDQHYKTPRLPERRLFLPITTPKCIPR